MYERSTYKTFACKTNYITARHKKAIIISHTHTLGIHSSAVQTTPHSIDILPHVHDLWPHVFGFLVCVKFSRAETFVEVASMSVQTYKF